MDPESWATVPGVSASGASGAGVVSIVSLSAMLFLFPFLNSLLYSFSPDGRKLASEAMAEASAASASTVVAGTVVDKWRHVGGFIFEGDRSFVIVVCGVVLHTDPFVF